MATGTADPCTFPRIPNDGHRAWSMVRDRELFRDYKVTYRVEVDPDTQGPYAALVDTPGLPEPCSDWLEAGELWAFFTGEAQVEQIGRTPDNVAFDVTFTATTRPMSERPNVSGSDPLTVPDRVITKSVNYQKEQTFNRFGDPMLNSAFEQFRGPQVEFDAHRMQVIIEQNYPTASPSVLSEFMNCLNDAEMWGFPPRTVKLSSFETDPKYYEGCQRFYVRKLVFDVAPDFDRCLLDEGTKVLRGEWDRNPGSPTYGQYIVADDEDGPFGKLDPANPNNYKRFQDWNGNNTRVILDGHGVPYDSENLTTGTSDDLPGKICVEYYPSKNLLLLGIPTSIDPAP